MFYVLGMNRNGIVCPPPSAEVRKDKSNGISFISKGSKVNGYEGTNSACFWVIDSPDVGREA